MNKKEIDNLMWKAKKSIEASNLLFNEEHYDFSSSRSYYSMFYCIEALLLSKNKSYSKHSGVISAFGKEFIKNRIFDSKYHRYILDAFEIRNIGDYGITNSINSETAKEMLKNSKELYEVVKKYFK